MANELPTNISYGTVTGRFLLAYADGSDSGSEPDGAAASGNVFFVPSVNMVKDSTASPDPVTILLTTVQCTLDSEGYLLGPAGTRGVRLLATNDTDGTPVNWKWTVKYSLTDPNGASIAGIPDQSISLPSQGTVDLSVGA